MSARAVELTSRLRALRRPLPRWLSRWETWALVGLVMGVTALVSHYALRYHTWQSDERAYIILSRYVAHEFPGSLFDFTYLDRGLQRLNLFFQAAVMSVFSTTATQLEVGHVVEALLFASTAVPTYLLARALGLEGRLALVPAALSVCMPGAVVGVTFLNESVAYPAVMWALYLIWRATVAPGVRSDLLAILGVGVAGLARTNLIGLAGVLLVATVVGPWLDVRGPGVTLRGAALAWPGRFLRQHPLVVILTAAILAYVGVAGVQRVVGEYPVPVAPDLSALWVRTQVVGMQLSLGLGFVPVALAAPWLARELVRPRSPGSGAFAVIAVSSALIIVYSASAAGFEDRYAMVLAPVFCVAGAIALFGRQASVLGTLVAGAVLARWVALHGLRPIQGPFDYFTYPAETFYRNIVLGNLSVHLPSVFAGHVATVAAVLAIAAAVALAGLSRIRTRAGSVARWAVVAGVLTSGVAAADYSMRKFVDQAGEPQTSFDVRTFVDRADGGSTAAILDGAGLHGYHALWIELTYWNGSLTDTAFYTGSSYPEPYPWGREVELRIDPRTGAVRANYPMPRYLVTVSRYQSVGFRARVVARSTYLPQPIEVLRLLGSPQAAVFIHGPDTDGYMRTGSTISVRVLPSALGPGRQCLSMTLIGGPYYHGPRRFAITGPGVHLIASVLSGVPHPVVIGLASGATSAGRHAPLLYTVRAHGADPLPDGRLVTGQLTDPLLGPCSG